MNQKLRADAEAIARGAIAAVCPDAAVRRALLGRSFGGKLYLVSVGKAGWKMAETALDCLEQPIEKGIVITKYGHVERPLPGIDCYEAGHPVPDTNTFRTTQAVLDMTEKLTEKDTVLFLLSGGGSALFEKPLVAPEELQSITNQLLARGADIMEMNTIRKRLSAVKGGRFAQWCQPAHVEAIVLSDILGDPLDMIASGPAAPDGSTCIQALSVVRKYRLNMSDHAWDLLRHETVKELTNVHSTIIGSVRELCRAASDIARELGYAPVLLTDRLDWEAREAGRFLAEQLHPRAQDGERIALLAGGETVVHLTGSGLGGRNQELALAAAEGIAGLHNVCLISVGSDGTDGPTDAAGGYVDGDTQAALAAQGLTISHVLAENDSYHALKAVDGLIFTGPTGTNVNDVAIGLIG